MTTRARVTGVVLAAGHGRRMGMPKALVESGDGSTWLARTVRGIAAAGCTDLLVVVGAEERRVRGSYEGPPVSFVLAQDWASGMGASLRAGLKALAVEAGEGPDAALITLVDLPDVGAPVVRRVLDHADHADAARDVLARATYDGRPGHPVLVGREHWAAMAATLSGDEGGRGYLDSRGAAAIECGDLASGRDQDTPPTTPGPA